MSVRVAVVTGGNKGIGFGIVKALCQQKPDWKIYATARDEGRGQAAIQELKGQGCNPGFCQLDLDSPQSIEKAKKYFLDTYGGIDVLVNNAGIAYKGASSAPFIEQAEVTLATNFTGTLNVCKSFIPILRPNARLVIVSSVVSIMALKKCSNDLRSKFTAPDLSLDQLVTLMNKFVSDVKSGVHEKEGWPSTAYGVSKIGCTCLAKIFQRDFDKDARNDMVANACCPGYVDTDMSSHKGNLTIEQGAENPVYLALLPPKTEIRGEFIREKKVTPWV